MKFTEFIMQNLLKIGRNRNNHRKIRLNTDNMETAYEFAKRELKDFTEFPTGSKIIKMLQEYSNAKIDMCAEIQQQAYKESGFTNTGKKINTLILNLKKHEIE